MRRTHPAKGLSGGLAEARLGGRTSIDGGKVGALAPFYLFWQHVLRLAALAVMLHICQHLSGFVAYTHCGLEYQLVWDSVTP